MANASITDNVNAMINNTNSPTQALSKVKQRQYEANNFNKSLNPKTVKFYNEILAKIAESRREAHLDARRSWDEAAKANKRDRQAQKEAKAEYLQTLREIANNSNASKRERKEAQEQLKAEARRETFLNGISAKINNAISSLSTGLNTHVKEQIKYLSSLNTRLQGTNKSYSSIVRLIDQNVGINAYIKQSKVFEKLNDYVSQGIAYNVEQRAFLGSISDKVAATFEANNAALLQIIKIQQADSTAARLGMESRLNKFLNSQFSDTSYLNSLSDTISASILGSSSQLSRNGSVEFEYAVQKWLGSMSSVGVSDAAIQSIAQGINALGTGDVNSLNSNAALQNLLVMSANQSGLNYSKLLSDGMNANTTNALMSGMVNYLQSISGIQNHVVKTQYANLFGMTISDLTALLNLSTEDLNSIADNMLSYSSLIDETSKSLNNIYTRITPGEIAENIYDNALTGAASFITGDIQKYLAYMAMNVVGDTLNNLLGETKLSPMGVGTSFKAGDLFKGGIAGLYTGLSFLNGLNNGTIASLSLDNWGATDTISQTKTRGLDATLADFTTGRGVSQTMFIGNNNTSDFYKQSLTQADEQVDAIGGTSKSVETAQEVSKIADITRDSIDPNVRAIRDILEQWNIMGMRVKMV